MNVTETAYLVDWSWFLSQPIVGGDPALALLFYADGTIRFKHRCKVVDGTQVVTAPALQLDGGHRYTEPMTVDPSILCPDCGTHGFVRAGRWEAA